MYITFHSWFFFLFFFFNFYFASDCNSAGVAPFNTRSDWPQCRQTQLVSDTRNDCKKKQTKNLQWSRWIKCNSAFTMTPWARFVSFLSFYMVKRLRSRAPSDSVRCQVCNEILSSFTLLLEKLLNSDSALKGMEARVPSRISALCAHLNRPSFHTEWV